MEKIAIITDSGEDLSVAYQKEYDIHVLPIIIQCNGKEYKDGVNINAEDVYKLQEKYVLKTASPAGGDVLDMFENLHKEGYTHAIVVMLSGGLSGTYNEVRLLAESQDDLKVAVYNSKTASIGCGAIALQLAKYRREGLSFEELQHKAEQLIKDTYVFFSIDSLEHLERGGRIGKATAFVGTALKIKPILSIDKETGEIDVASKVRGSKKVPQKLLDMIAQVVQNYPNRPFNLVVADGAMPSQRDNLELELKALYPQYHDMIQARIGAGLSCYVGPGLLGAGIQFL